MWRNASYNKVQNTDEDYFRKELRGSPLNKTDQTPVIQLPYQLLLSRFLLSIGTLYFSDTELGLKT